MPMNAPLVLLACGALFAGFLGIGYDHFKYGWIGSMINQSTAYVPSPSPQPHHAVMGMDLHLFMQVISGIIAISGIALSWYLFSYNRPAAARVAAMFGPLATICRNKYYMDEIYAAIFVHPLRFFAYVFYIFDHLVIDGLVALIGYIPRAFGAVLRPTQSGRLQGYGLGMLGGLAILAVLALAAMKPWAW